MLSSYAQDPEPWTGGESLFSFHTLSGPPAGDEYDLISGYRAVCAKGGREVGSAEQLPEQLKALQNAFVNWVNTNIIAFQDPALHPDTMVDNAVFSMPLSIKFEGRVTVAWYVEVRNQEGNNLLFSTRDEATYLMPFTKGPVALQIMLPRKGETAPFIYTVMYSEPAFHEEMQYIRERGASFIMDGHIGSNILSRILSAVQKSGDSSAILDLEVEELQIAYPKLTAAYALIVETQQQRHPFFIGLSKDMKTAEIQPVREKELKEHGFMQKAPQEPAQQEQAAQPVPQKHSMPALMDPDLIVSYERSCGSQYRSPATPQDYAALEDLRTRFSNYLLANESPDQPIRHITFLEERLLPGLSGPRYCCLAQVFDEFGRSLHVSPGRTFAFADGRVGYHLESTGVDAKLRCELLYTEKAYKAELAALQSATPPPVTPLVQAALSVCQKGVTSKPAAMSSIDVVMVDMLADKKNSASLIIHAQDHSYRVQFRFDDQASRVTVW